MKSRIKKSFTDISERKYKNKLGDKAQNDKVIAALMRKGYSYSEIREALSQFNTPTDYCEDY